MNLLQNSFLASIEKPIVSIVLKSNLKTKRELKDALKSYFLTVHQKSIPFEDSLKYYETVSSAFHIEVNEIPILEYLSKLVALNLQSIYELSGLQQPPFTLEQVMVLQHYKAQYDDVFEKKAEMLRAMNEEVSGYITVNGTMVNDIDFHPLIRQIHLVIHGCLSKQIESNATIVNKLFEIYQVYSFGEQKPTKAPISDAPKIYWSESFSPYKYHAEVYTMFKLLKKHHFIGLSGTSENEASIIQLFDKINQSSETITWLGSMPELHSFIDLLIDENIFEVNKKVWQAVASKFTKKDGSRYTAIEIGTTSSKKVKDERLQRIKDAVNPVVGLIKGSKKHKK
jgi:hypothetical protein